MLKIRLRREGKRGQPSYRIVVADSRAPRQGRFVERVGIYNPLTNPPTITLDEAKITEWLKKGAQPSEAVISILRQKGLLEKKDERAN